MKKGVVLSVLLIFFISSASATLGITPAISDIDFVAGEEYKFNFRIISDDPEQEIEAYIGGAFEEYAELSENKFVGPSSFSVTIKLPDEPILPGENRLTVGVKEIPPEDQFLGTAVEIRGLIRVFVPFPGTYIETRLAVPDGNIDDLIPVEAYVINRGEEDLTVDTTIDFFEEGGNPVSKMNFDSVDLVTTQEGFFRRFLNTSGMKPGDYTAQATFNYGRDSVSVAEDTFRIGSLFVNVVDFTDRLPKRGIEKFKIKVENKWNGYISEVFADVTVSNGIQEESFRTPSVDLNAWDDGTLIGFLDTSELEGAYETEIVLNYEGQTSTTTGTLLVTESNMTLILAIVGGIIGVILIILITVWVTKRKTKRRRR